MEQVQVFNFNGSDVRTVSVNGQPYFVGKDVADVLGYSNTRDALNKHVDTEDKNTVAIRDGITRGNPNQTVINESGLYSLILSSKMPNAKEFKHWVTSEVLPSIRKHGAYMTPKTVEDVLLSPDTIITLAKQIKSERAKNERLKKINNRMKPHAILGAVVASSVNSIPVKVLATLLKENGIDIGQNRLFIWLRERGYLSSRAGRSWNMPTQKAMNLGLFELKTNPIVHNSGEMETKYTPLVTGKGQKYFINKFMNDKTFDF